MTLYRLLLLCFPPDFRARFGHDMADVFADRLLAARRAGVRATLMFWIRAIIDVVSHGLRERRLVRRTRRESLFGSLIEDVRFDVRILYQRPTFTSAAIVTLALGIGANVASFSAVRAVLLDEPRYPDANRIVQLTVGVPRMLPQPMNSGDLEAIRAQTRIFDIIGSCTWATVFARGNGEMGRLEGPFASQDFFRVFNTPPLLGRTFATEEFTNGSRVTLLSEHTWRSQFGGASDVVGRTIQLNREPWTIVGVMPASFAPPCRGNLTGDVWRPFVPESNSPDPILLTFAHLAPGVTVEAARREIQRLQTTKATASLGEHGAVVSRFKEDDQNATRPGLLLLQGVAILLLLITCANIANLFLTHAAAREHEFGVRSALGASRSRLVRLQLLEAILIALAGTAVGASLALWIVPRLVLTGPGRLGVIPPNTVLSVEAPELIAAFALSWLTAMLFGVAPAWMNSNVAVVSALRVGRYATTNRMATVFRAGLVGAEVLLAAVVLTGTALLIRSFANVLELPMGFEPHGLVVASYAPWQDGRFVLDRAASRLLTTVH